jgi:hypothetical protein
VEGGEEFGYVAGVVEVDWHQIDRAFVRAESLASTLVGKGCQRCTVALQAMLALYLCVSSRLRHAELLLASS